jgi:chaperonin GroES
MAEKASKADLQQFVQNNNLAADMDQKDLDTIGLKICEWLDIDEQARSDWTKRNDQWLKLATQVVETKNYPWPNAANVKFPLLTTAAMQFAARAYPALVPGPNLVQGLVIGRDMDSQKQETAQRIGRHMSYQLLWEMDGWEEDMDKLCMTLPIVGCMFKKTYFDPIQQKNCSELLFPNDLVIDYYAKSVESATRKSQILWRTNNEIWERVQRGVFLDIPYPDPTGKANTEAKDKIDGTQEPSLTPSTPHRFIECHCWWDLDDDGYDEPYIVTVHYETKKVVRIIARFDSDGIETVVDAKGKEKLVRIKPIEYFTKFGFIPNPDGSIYDLGFGLLLGGINESINTLTNQLLDSGTLNNLQAGFLGRGIRVRSGTTRFIPGEWKPVDFTGDDIKKHIFPLPTKEPSEVLFKLLETFVSSGKELASVAEIFVGKMPGQNTPATTTMATIEQGLKVFTAIYKRIYRALAQEYQKLFYLNHVNLPEESLYFTLNQPEGPQTDAVAQRDYDTKNISVKPNADPNIVSSAQKLMKVQSYGSLLQLGTLNPKEYTKRFLEAVEAENIKSLMDFQPPPSADQQKLEGEMKLKQAEAQQKAMLNQQEAQLKQLAAELDAKDKQLSIAIKQAEAELDQRKSMSELMRDVAQMRSDMQRKDMEHGQKLIHSEREQQQKMRHTEDKAISDAAAAKLKAESAPKKETK